MEVLNPATGDTIAEVPRASAADVDPRLLPLRHLATAYARRDPVSRVAVVGNAPMEPSPSRARLIDEGRLPEPTARPWRRRIQYRVVTGWQQHCFHL